MASKSLLAKGGGRLVGSQPTSVSSVHQLHSSDNQVLADTDASHRKSLKMKPLDSTLIPRERRLETERPSIQLLVLLLLLLLLIVQTLPVLTAVHLEKVV